MKKLIFLPLLLFTLACPHQPLEQTARDAVATAKGYLESAKANHPECVPQPAHPQVAPAASTMCSIINRGIAGKDLVIDALETYCANPDFDSKGGVCTPNKDAEPKLRAALSNLNQILKDVKGIEGKQ